MSILDKHPAPWMIGQCEPLRDAKGVGIYYLEPCDPSENTEEVERLILAAPELLAILKEMVDHGECVSLYQRAEALIARIEGGK